MVFVTVHVRVSPGAMVPLTKTPLGLEVKSTKSQPLLNNTAKPVTN